MVVSKILFLAQASAWAFLLNIKYIQYAFTSGIIKGKKDNALAHSHNEAQADACARDAQVGVFNDMFPKDSTIVECENIRNSVASSR